LLELPELTHFYGNSPIFSTHMGGGLFAQAPLLS
jgi:hypothetical protein